MTRRLVGLSMVLAVAAEQMRTSAPAHNVPAGQVAVASPVIAPGWWTVEAFIDYLIATGNHETAGE